MSLEVERYQIFIVNVELDKVKTNQLTLLEVDLWMTFCAVLGFAGGVLFASSLF